MESVENINHSRRRWLSLGGVALGASALPLTATATISTPKPISMRFHNVNTGEHLSSNLSTGYGFVSSELNKLNHIFRDCRSGQVARMDTNLFYKLNQIQTHFGFRNAEFKIISGYRSPSTNARLRRRSHGVAKNSYHTQARAMDIRLSGISLSRLRNAVKSLNSGGVGYYPNSNFVHIDTGPVRYWRG